MQWHGLRRQAFSRPPSVSHAMRRGSKTKVSKTKVSKTSVSRTPFKTKVSKTRVSKTRVSKTGVKHSYRERGDSFFGW